MYYQKWETVMETRQIPCGDGSRFNWLIPVDKNGEPKRKSRAWQEMIVSIAARSPDKRTPAETACLRSEMAK
jgi:hypothetical protein